jgi:hypothetical protein
MSANFLLSKLFCKVTEINGYSKHSFRNLSELTIGLSSPSNTHIVSFIF